MAAKTAGLDGMEVSYKDGDEMKKVDPETLFAENDVVGLYFSAHWCPPCKGFTPILTSTYNTLRGAGSKFEVVFVSSDNSKEEFDHYFGEMPWKAVEFTQEKTMKLGEKYGVRGIPSLIILDKKGNIVRQDGRMLVHKFREAAFPFDEKTIKALEDI